MDVLRNPLRKARRRALFTTLLALSLLAIAAWAVPSQSQSTGQQQPSSPQQKPPEAGGPAGDVGPIALPKRPEPQPVEPRPKKPEGMPDFSLRVDVPLVNVDVFVTTKDGQFIPNLTSQHFRVYEDGVPQKISSFTQGEAAITAVLLVEYAAPRPMLLTSNCAQPSYEFLINSLQASYSFANSLKPEDWIAVISYDMRPHILVDFTQDKHGVYQGLRQLNYPGFSETNLFDALYDTLDRLEGVEGRKYIILVSSGCDSFSRINYDDILKKVKATPNVTIFSVATGEAWLRRVDAYAGERHDVRMMQVEFLQAKNQLATFARLTGGRSYVPQFDAEFPQIFQDIAGSIRQQYKLSYRPTNAKQDGTFRKIKVELVAPNGGPLKVLNEKGKEVKYQILARDGYNARREVE